MDVPEPEDVVVVGEAADPLAAGTAQVTDVDPDELPASAELADALQRVPGAVVTRLGGPGDYAQVSLRGAAGRQVEVLVDGIPLNPEGGAAVDLSDLPLAAFEQVRVIRGLSPALLGSTALGGAVLLVPGAGDRTVRAATLAAGSGPTGHAAATLGGPVGPVHVWTAVDALGTGGAFRYYDDAGTRFTQADDGVQHRVNNDTARLSAVARASWQGVTALYVGLRRRDGVPGFTFAPSPHARYALDRHLAGLRVERPVGRAIVAARAYGVLARRVARRSARRDRRRRRHEPRPPRVDRRRRLRPRRARRAGPRRPRRPLPGPGRAGRPRRGAGAARRAAAGRRPGGGAERGGAGGGGSRPHRAAGRAPGGGERGARRLAAARQRRRGGAPAGPDRAVRRPRRPRRQPRPAPGARPADRRGAALGPRRVARGGRGLRGAIPRPRRLDHRPAGGRAAREPRAGGRGRARGRGGDHAGAWTFGATGR
ncbi:MAG: TonB-dependent receptor plug domain-containing protein [Myxococcota bacterium]